MAAVMTRENQQSAGVTPPYALLGLALSKADAQSEIDSFSGADAKPQDYPLPQRAQADSCTS